MPDLEALILSVYTQRQLLYLNEAMDKVLIIAEVPVMLKNTKTHDTFNALYHSKPGLRDQSYPYYGSIKRPSACCETPGCKAGRFVLFWPLRLSWHPEDLCSLESLCCGAADSHKKAPCRDTEPRAGERRHPLKAGE